MDSYIVSARKYRPITFDTVVGQQSLTTTLKNAIATGKLAHAYLFCGPRGVGKTTCARIFAKTINCLQPTASGEACDNCESCRSFNEQRSFNIHELDAASNNSVDDIRLLIDQVRVPPQVGKYKVYIIDEVHMLSQSAFNAFLKTLEEPPHHTIFILATTEKHKILPTILSRCQIYDFTRITLDDIEKHLMNVAQNEGIVYEAEALNVIAQKADGGMRDALSIFDQVASFTGGNITYQATIENLNVLDYEYYFKLTDTFLNQDIKGALLLLDEVLRKGFDAGHFMTGLSTHFRDLLVSRDEVTLPLLEVGSTIRERYSQQAVRCNLPFLYAAMKLCNDCDLNYRASKNKRLLVELTLIQVGQLLEENKEVSGGRSPEKILKPLFNQKQTQVSASATPETTIKEQPVVVVSQNEVTPHTPASAVAQTERKRTPLRAPSFGPAIRKNEQTSEYDTTPVVTQEVLAETVVQQLDKPVTQESLGMEWRSFAIALPKVQAAYSGRLLNISPCLQEDGVTILTKVENSIVEQHILEMKASLEQHLRTRLQNTRLEIKVEIHHEEQRIVALNDQERFQMMLKKSEELNKLRQMLNLRLV